MPNHAVTDINVTGIDVTITELLALRGDAKRLNLAPRGKVLSTSSGGHLSRFRGRGMEFDESRPYQPGDEVRNMDWRVTARTGVPHVKLFREEREYPVWILVDFSSSMRFGTKVAFKSVIAAKAAALLAWATVDRGDRVGGLVFNENRCFERPPVARTNGLLPFLRALAQPQLIGDIDGYPDLTSAASHLQHKTRPGSLVFILSDFNGVTRDNSAWLSHMGIACELVLVHIYDSIEEIAPPLGRYPVTEHSRRGIFNISSAAERDLWQRRFKTRVNLLEDLTLHHQAHFLSLSTNAPIASTLALGLQPRLNKNYVASARQ